MSKEEILRCYNRSCGKEYAEKENTDDACVHHPGMPVFHDALKGWSCCQRRVTDFTEFLNIQGCTKSRHSNIKPPEPEVKPSTQSPGTIINNTQHSIVRKPKNKNPEPRPSDDLPYQRLKYSVSDSLKTALQKQRESGTTCSEKINENIVQKGTSCKNNGCNSLFEDERSNSEKCLYHPGNPVFHEGYKFWSCCLLRTSDFDEFLRQKGCLTGSHTWISTDEQKKKAVSCRYDHYQMGSSVIISVYAKLSDAEKSFVQANQTCIKAALAFGNGSHFELDIRLHGVIDPDRSSVLFSATKVEIKLRKKEASNWPRLELKSQ